MPTYESSSTGYQDSHEKKTLVAVWKLTGGKILFAMDKIHFMVLTLWVKKYPQYLAAFQTGVPQEI